MFFKTPWEDVRLPRGAKFNSRIEDRWRSFSLEEVLIHSKIFLSERLWNFFNTSSFVRSWNRKEIQNFRYYFLLKSELREISERFPPKFIPEEGIVPKIIRSASTCHESVSHARDPVESIIYAIDTNLPRHERISILIRGPGLRDGTATDAGQYRISLAAVLWKFVRRSRLDTMIGGLDTIGP